MKSQFKDQIGGTHYSELVIQPIEYIVKNKLDWHEGNIVKYVTRHKLKGGAQDIKKVVHYALLELEQLYGIKSKIEYDDEKPVNATQRYRKKKRRKPEIVEETIPGKSTEIRREE